VLGVSCAHKIFALSVSVLGRGRVISGTLVPRGVVLLLRLLLLLLGPLLGSARISRVPSVVFPQQVARVVGYQLILESIY
jgi:hypothetical protein